MGTAAICIVKKHYLCHRYVPNRGQNFPLSLAIIGQIETNGNRFSKFKMAGILASMHFRRHPYAPHRSPNVSTNFSGDQSNTKDMAAVFRNQRWRQPPS